jgi:hypothetical protein
MCEFRVSLHLTRNSHAIQTGLRHSLITFSLHGRTGATTGKHQRGGRVSVKRIAAVAALIVAMLAVPAAAMASTGSSGSDHTASGQFACPKPYLFQHRPHNVRIRGRIHVNRYFRHNRHNRVIRGCPFPLPYQGPPQAQQFCGAGNFTFDLASGSSTFTEVSGPRLAAAQEFTYDGNTYTVWTVNPGGDSFTAALNNSLFVNEGSSITDGSATLLCSG